MPWQQYVYDVAGEIDPATGCPAYREVIITVPRQNGKTAVLLTFMADRCVSDWGGPQRVLYGAQTGKDAKEKLVEDLAPQLIASGLRSALHPVKPLHQGTGNEKVVWRNGSLTKLLNSSDSSGHGKTTHQAQLDEVWKYEDNAAEQAALPSMNTVADAQLFITSTAGTDESTYLLSKVTLGRELVAADDTTSGIAYFEWSADPDADLDDPVAWRSCMPALGHTITEATVRHARRSMTDDAEFARAYLNIWPGGRGADWLLIPEGVWGAVQGDEETIPQGRLSFALEVRPDRSGAAIVAADPDGTVELVECRPEVGWAADRVIDLTQRHDGVAVLDERSPAAPLVPTLEDACELVKLSTKDVVAACGGFFDKVADGALAVRPHPELTDSVAGARKRKVGDAWVWNRDPAGANAAPVMAASLAVHVAALAPPRKKRGNVVWLWDDDEEDGDI